MPMIMRRPPLLMLLALSAGIACNSGTGEDGSATDSNSGAGTDTNTTTAGTDTTTGTDTTAGTDTETGTSETDTTSGETDTTGDSDACGAEGICAQLEILEAKALGDAGTDREGALVTVGVPLPESAAVMSVDQLGLVGAGAGQFRPLAYHAGGQISWVELDFPIDLAADATAQVDLVAGEGAFGGPDMAQETGDMIRIDTGAAVFEIAKDGSSLLRSVKVQGAERLAESVDVFATRGGIEYLGSKGNQATLSLDHNGPVKSVVSLRGRLYSAQDEPFLWFTARMHFVVGKAQVDVELTFRNADEEEYETLFFEDLGAKLKLQTEQSLEVTIAAQSGGSWTDTLTDGGSASLRQAAVLEHPANTDNLDSAYGWPGCQPPLAGVRCLPAYEIDNPGDPCRRGDGEACPASCGDCEAYGFEFLADLSLQGLSVDFNGAPALGPGNQEAASYTTIQDGERQFTMAQRWMVNQFPAAQSVDSDGKIVLRLRAMIDGIAPDRLNWGGHLSRRFALAFGDENPQEVAASQDHPLVARADLDHYRMARSFRGDDRVIAIADDAGFATVAGQDLPLDAPRFQVPQFVHWRRNYYHPGRALFNFWRGGSPEYARQFIARAAYEANAAIIHSDGFDLSERPDIRPMLPGTPGQNPYDGGHQISGYLPDAYRAFGDEGVHEAIEDYGEDVLEQIIRGEFPFPETIYYRAWLRRFENLTWLFEFSGDTRYETEVFEGIDQLLDVFAAGSFAELGRDPDRGFIYKAASFDRYADALGVPPAPDHPRGVHLFFGASISGETYYQVMRTLQSVGMAYRLEELEDLVLGHALFLRNELGTVNGEFLWTGEDYCLGPVPDPDNPLLLDSYVCSNFPAPADAFTDNSIYAWTRYALHIYDMMGDASVLDDAMAVLEARMLWTSSAEDLSEMQHQALLDAKQNQRPPRYGYSPLELNVSPEGGGKYTLSWVVPEGATRFRIKASERNIVDWLGFDQVTREFTYAPDQYEAWFAAKALADPPAPAAAGEMQSWQVTFGTGSNASFAAKFSAAP